MTVITTGPYRDVPEGFVSGNTFDKYSCRNRLFKGLVDRFVGSARDLLAVAAPAEVLEVGCGPGDLAARLLAPTPGGPPPPAYVGTDVSAREVEAARARHPWGDFRVASAYALPFPDASFDLVVACEVFEHLERPHDALREAERVCRSYLLASVPWEPVWRAANVLRGKYLSRLGDTPGHVQHFTRGGARRFLGRRFDLVAERRPFPWTMILAKRRETSGR